MISVIESGADFSGAIVWDSVLSLAVQLTVGALCGIGVGFLTVKAVNAINTPNEFLSPVLVISCCFCVYGDQHDRRERVSGSICSRTGSR